MPASCWAARATASRRLVSSAPHEPAGARPTSGTRTRRILYGGRARAALIRGVDQMAALVAPTLGPTAGTVAIDSLVSQTPEILDSGATIVRRTIQLADPFEDMGGMLVRHVLLSVFERVGDGTATTAVLTRALVHGLERYTVAGGNVRQVERGLRCALEMTLNELNALAQPISGVEALAKVAAAVVHDPAIAQVIAEILDGTGADGAVVVEGGEALETTYEYMEGMRWNEGVVSEALLGLGQTTTRLIEPRILITDCALERPEQLMPVLEACAAAGERRLFVVAPEVHEAVVGLLAVNRDGRVFDSVAAVRAPATGDVRAAILGDLAVATGARLLQAAAGGLTGFTLADLGTARQVWVTRQAFGLVGGRGTRGAVRQRAAEARAELNRAGDDRHLRSMAQQRIGKLLGLGAVIRVGAATPLAREELLLRAEAGVTAARLALREGVVPGGGATLVACAAALRALQLPGDEGVATAILIRALSEPMRRIVRNAGFGEPGGIVDQACRRGLPWTFDVVRGAWVDAWQAGLLDPVAVLRAALDSSVSAACTALTTGALVRRRQAPPPAGR
ncbi:MAG: chaperonin GroEL [Chloroflexota bacterium]